MAGAERLRVLDRAVQVRLRRPGGVERRQAPRQLRRDRRRERAAGPVGVGRLDPGCGQDLERDPVPGHVVGTLAADVAALDDDQAWPEGVDPSGSLARGRFVHDLEAGKWADATRDLAAVRSSQVPVAPFEDWGRLVYWQGRCAQLTGHADKAKAFYTETVATAPVTYYALLALHRLEEQKPGDGAALLAMLVLVPFDFNPLALFAEAAERAGLSNKKIFSFLNIHEAAMQIQQRIQRGDLILVKGSQGVRMERIVKEVMAEPLLASELLVRQSSAWFKKQGLYD